MEQNELLKLRNNETMIIKPAGKGGAVVIFAKDYHKIMIIQHLLDEKMYKRLVSCIDNKIQTNFLRFLRQYKTSK